MACVGLHGDAGVFVLSSQAYDDCRGRNEVICRDSELAERLRHLRAFGVDRSHGERSLPGMYDVPELGFNYRMSEIHAAIGIEQVKKLPNFIQHRKNNYDHLSGLIEDLPGVSLLKQKSDARFNSVYYCAGMMLDDGIRSVRPQIMNALKEMGVGSSIYYPKPVPQMMYYQKKYQVDPSMYKVAQQISDRSISLPVGPHISFDDVEYMADCLSKILRKFCA